MIAPQIIRNSRKLAGMVAGKSRPLSQQAAADLLYKPARRWRSWESGQTAISPALFELFLIKSRIASPDAAGATIACLLYPDITPSEKAVTALLEALSANANDSQSETEMRTGIIPAPFIISCYIGPPIFKILGYIGPPIF